MKRSSLLLAVLALFCSLGLSAAASAFPFDRGSVVVANRASGTVSVIDVDTDQVVDTISLPGTNTPEPMYVVHVRRVGQIFVGDRANDQVVALDDDTFEIAGTVPTGNGVFHMWADRAGRQLWVNNDVDNTVTVIDTRSLTTVATVPLPADLVANGGKPHDVVVSKNGRAAFVSVIGVDGPDDYVVKYSTKSFEEVARVALGKDPHLSLTPFGRRLYVPTQNANEVAVFRTRDLAPVTTIPVPAAHGAAMGPLGYFYTTSIAGGGVGGLVTIDIWGTGANTAVGDTDTPFAVPHNIAVTGYPWDVKVYVTHSGGTADKVSVYTASSKNPVPVPAGDVTVGLNPFGLAVVP